MQLLTFHGIRGRAAPVAPAHHVVCYANASARVEHEVSAEKQGVGIAWVVCAVLPCVSIPCSRLPCSIIPCDSLPCSHLPRASPHRASYQGASSSYQSAASILYRAPYQRVIQPHVDAPPAPHQVAPPVRPNHVPRVRRDASKQHPDGVRPFVNIEVGQKSTRLFAPHATRAVQQHSFVFKPSTVAVAIASDPLRELREPANRRFHGAEKIPHPAFVPVPDVQNHG